jgi:acyl transferase domain-containing protein/acyl carrier protein
MLDAFEEAAGTVDFHSTKIDFVSTVTGKLVEDGALNSPTYWRRHVRSTVRFAEAMHTLQDAGYEMFIEIGPDPTLLALGKRIFSQQAGLWLPSLRDGRDEWRQMLDSLAKLYVHGAEVDWEGFDKDYPRQRIHNPTYPFQRERFWFKPAKEQSTGGVFSGEKGPHPLVGWKLRAATSKDTIFETHLSIELYPYLGDHQIFEYWIVPSPVYIEMVLSAASTVSGDRNQRIENMEVHKAMFLSKDEDHVVQLVLKEQGQGNRRFGVYGLEGKEWVLFASGTIGAGQSNEAPVRPDALADFKARINTEVDVSNYYKQMGQIGLNFGPLFRGIQSMWRTEGQALGLIRIPEPLVDDSSAYAWIHPVVLDTCFHLIGVALADDSEDISDAYLLLGINQLQFYQRPGRQFWGHVSLHPSSTEGESPSAGEIISADIHLYDQEGQIVAEILGFHLKRARQETLRGLTPHKIDDLLYEVAWIPKDRMSDSTIGVPTGYLQTGTSIHKNVGPHVKHLAEQYKLDLYKSFLPRLDELCFYHIVRSFEEMGWNFQVGEALSVEILSARLGIDKQYHRLLGRMLEILHEEGIVTPSQHAWEVMVKPDQSTSEEDWSDLIDQFPVFNTEVSLTQRCVQSLPAVLRGDQDPLQLLFPGGSFADLEKLYQDSPGSQMYNSLIQDVIINALEAYPADQPLRIAEIGAGTGGTTSFLLPELARERTQYYFTDISQLFLAKAREKFTEYPFIHYQYLDIEQSPASQGFPSRGFELVLAANVIHATQDLRQSLGHIQELLAPGGLLVLLEGTGSHRWVDLTFGLTEGWWRFTDTDVRPTYPLLSEEKWDKLLSELGFEEIAVISESQQDSGNLSKQAVIVATMPQTKLKRNELPQEKESWLIVSNDERYSAQLAELVNTSGDQSILVTPGDAFETMGNRHYQIDLKAPDNYRLLFQEINRNQEGPISNIIHLLSPDSIPSDELALRELEHGIELGCRSALYLLQATLEAELSRTPQLWLVTQQAQSINLDETLTDVSQSTLWGLGRTIEMEHPEIWGGLVDIESTGSVQIAATIYDEISKSDGENQVALRGDQRLVARLVRYSEHTPLEDPITFQKNNTYLITGGLGGIGLQVIQWMVDRGARHLVLVGRRELYPEAEQVLNRLKSQDAQVTYLRADISIEPDVIQVLGKISQSMPPLAGIIHAAGIFDDRVLLRHDWDRFKRVLAPKVNGAWLLHRGTEHMRLDFFVLFASSASFLGTPGLGNYAAANAFLDALAVHRRNLGLPAVSIDWGPWEKVGMAKDVGSQRQSQWIEAGFGTMTPQQGLEVFERLLHKSPVQVGALPVYWPQYLERFGPGGEPPIFSEVAKERKPRDLFEGQELKQVSILERLDQIPQAARRDYLLDYLNDQVVQVLGFERSYKIDVDQGFLDLGIDSLMALDLKNQLQIDLGHTLPSTLVYDYPNLDALVDYIAGDILSLKLTEEIEVASSEESTEVKLGSEGEIDLSEDELADLLRKKLKEIQ